MVTFKSLELKNFKSYKNVTIPFENGITMIIGENGAGKSTIFEAISFALFKKSTARKIDALIRTGINEKEKMSVTLKFNVYGEDYQVTRVKSKSSSSAELSKIINNTPNLLATGDKNVNEEILKILGMDDDLFLNAIYVRQGEIANLVSKTPSDRKKLISKLLGVENLELAWNNLLPIINNYTNKKAEYTGKLSNEQELTYNLNRRLEDKETLNSDMEKLNNNISKRKEELERSNTNLKEMEKVKEEYYELKNRENSEKELLNNFQKEKQELKEELNNILRCKDEIGRLEKYVNKLPVYQDFKDIYYKIKSIQEEKNNLMEKAKQLDKLNNSIKEEKPYYDSYLKVESQLKKLKEEKIELDKKQTHFKQLDIERLNYQQEVKNETMELNAFIDEIKQVIKDETPKTLEEYKTIILHFEGENNEKIEEKNNKLKQYNSEIAILKSKIKDSKEDLKELENIKDECPVCKSQITIDKKEELTNNYNTIIEQSNTRINILESEINNLNQDITILTNSQKTLNSINNRFYNYQRINESINIHNTKIENLTSEIILKKDNDAHLVKIEREIQNLEKDYTDLEQHYKNYLLSQGKLQDMGNENEIKDQLYRIHGQNINYVEKLRECVAKDIFLTEQTPIKDVDSKIEELTLKKERYDQLKGKVLGEENLKTKIDEKTNIINVKKQSIENINEKLTKTIFDEIKYQQIKTNNEKINQNYNILIQNKGIISGKLEELEKTIKDYQERINKNNTIKLELMKTNEYLEFLNTIRDAFSRDGIQKDLRELARPLIQKYTKLFFEKFNFNYSDLILDEDFSISVYGPEGESDLDMVSGGEKIAIAIALRLGITQSMGQGGIDTILLDEPTVHLDSYRRHELVDIIRSMNILPQMIIVTHDSELESAADNVITVIKENGVSKIK